MVVVAVADGGNQPPNDESPHPEPRKHHRVAQYGILSREFYFYRKINFDNKIRIKTGQIGFAGGGFREVGAGRGVARGG